MQLLNTAYAHPFHPFPYLFLNFDASGPWMIKAPLGAGTTVAVRIWKRATLVAATRWVRKDTCDRNRDSCSYSTLYTFSWSSWKFMQRLTLLNFVAYLYTMVVWCGCIYPCLFETCSWASRSARSNGAGIRMAAGRGRNNSWWISASERWTRVPTAETWAFGQLQHLQMAQIAIYAFLLFLHKWATAKQLRSPKLGSKHEAKAQKLQVAMLLAKAISISASDFLLFSMYRLAEKRNWSKTFQYPPNTYNEFVLWYLCRETSPLMKMDWCVHHLGSFHSNDPEVISLNVSLCHRISFLSLLVRLSLSHKGIKCLQCSSWSFEPSGDGWGGVQKSANVLSANLDLTFLMG